MIILVVIIVVCCKKGKTSTRVNTSGSGYPRGNPTRVPPQPHHTGPPHTTNTVYYINPTPYNTVPQAYPGAHHQATTGGQQGYVSGQYPITGNPASVQGPYAGYQVSVTGGQQATQSAPPPAYPGELYNPGVTSVNGVPPPPVYAPHQLPGVREGWAREAFTNNGKDDRFKSTARTVIKPVVQLPVGHAAGQQVPANPAEPEPMPLESTSDQGGI